MHSFGFLSHPHAAPSVLSYVNKGQRSLTPLDADLIHTLYDPRLTAGHDAGRCLATGLPHPGRAHEILGARHRSGMPRPPGTVIGELGRRLPSPYSTGGISSVEEHRAAARDPPFF